MSRLIKRLVRARAESGHTLIELVVSMAIGMGILLIAFHLLDRSLGLTREVSDRVEAVQKGRLAMDTMTRQLRSQVCLPTTSVLNGMEAAVVSADGDAVTFYSNLGTTGVPERNTFAFNEAAKTITHTQVKGSGTAGAPPITFTAAPKVTTMLTNAARNGASPATAPVFKYYGFNTAAVPPSPTTLLGPVPLTQIQRESTARIVISFVSRPPQAKTTNKKAAVLTDEIFVRSADPNDPAPVPKCA